MRFTTTLPKAFDVLERSINGSYIRVRTLSPGHVRLVAQYDGIVDKVFFGGIMKLSCDISAPKERDGNYDTFLSKTTAYFIPTAYMVFMVSTHLQNLSPPILAEQGADIFDPIKIHPDVLMFPWDPVNKAKYHYRVNVRLRS